MIKLINIDGYHKNLFVKMMILLAQQPPIVLMHGFTASLESMEKIRKWLDEENFTVVNCEVGNGGEDSTVLPISQQAQLFYECLQQHEVLSHGFIGVGHSQGGVILRYYLQMINEIKMLRMVTIASPLAGYYCTDLNNCANIKIPAGLVYSDAIQKSLAPSNYWRDPKAYSQYVEKSLTLALLNNERGYDVKRKQNFMSVDKIVMFGSSYDNVIFPWQSSFFGFYKNDTFTVVPMEQTEVYIQDLFGLKSMDDQGRIIQIHTNFLHSDYNSNETFVKNDLAQVLRFEAKSKDTLTTSAKIGIAAGIICLLIIIVCVILGYFWYKNKRTFTINHDPNVQLDN